MRFIKADGKTRTSAGCLSAALLFLQIAPAFAQQSLSLHEAIRLGLAQAPEARTSSDRVELERAQIANARLRPNPRLYLQSEDLRPWAQSFSFENDTEDYGYVSDTFELDGKRSKRIAYAESGVRRSEAEHVLELRQIAAGIDDSYWAAEAATASATEWQYQLADFDRLVQYQSARVQAGATAGVDLLRTQIERDRTALKYAQAQRTASAAEIDLARRIADPAARRAVLTDSLEQERPVAERSIGTAVEQRPEVMAAREALDEAEADLRLQHSSAVPNLDLLGGYKRDVGENTIYGGLQIDLPIFNRNQGGIAAASASRQLAEDELAYMRLTARADIETAQSAYECEQSLVRSTLPGMDERAAQNSAIIAEAYRSGGADLLRYLDAEQVRLETKLLAIETWTEYQRAATALQLAYGEQP